MLDQVGKLLACNIMQAHITIFFYILQSYDTGNNTLAYSHFRVIVRGWSQ